MSHFTFTCNGKTFSCTSLKELKACMLTLTQEEADSCLTLVILDLLAWLKTQYPEQLHLITSLEDSQKEFTGQQFRELLIRELQNIPE